MFSLFLSKLETGAVLAPAPQVGNLLLARRERWIACFLWYGTILLSLAAALAPFDHTGSCHPSTFFLQLGAVLVAVAAALELGRRRAACAAPMRTFCCIAAHKGCPVRGAKSLIRLKNSGFKKNLAGVLQEQGATPRICGRCCAGPQDVVLCCPQLVHSLSP